MHRTSYTIIVTTPVPQNADWDVGQRMAELLEDDLPAGSTVEVVDAEELEEDA